MAKPYMVSPFGEALHPWISTFDVKYNAEGLFHTGLKLDPGPETEDFITTLKQAAQAGYDEEMEKLTGAERKRYTLYVPAREEEDADGNQTGRWIVDFKQNRIIKLRDGTTKEVTIGVKDASGKKDVLKPVWAGSIIRVMFTMRTNKMVSSKQAGVRLDFASVQVKHLVTAGQGRSFGSVEDGYEELDERDQAAFDPAAPIRSVHDDY